MPSYEMQYDVTITDFNGDTATMHVSSFYPDTTTISGLVGTLTTLAGDIAACTNGKVTATGFHFLIDKAQISTATAPPPSNATYPSVTDGARLAFANSNGGRRVVVVPAPLLSDFLANSNTVNPGDANVSALIAEIEALADNTGSTNLYEGGVKVGRHSRRRATRKHL